ncbi:hypothetical protein [Nocardia concava]|uniref:hypothetical protein n=1 Tax=Nocardia concava TaxID=257281 RepID=UPI0003147DD0|nr:hypothetical protein [Nocardia concava]
MSENFPNTPEEIEALTARLRPTDEPLNLGDEMAPESAADAAPGMVARSVKLPDDLDMMCGMRAGELNLSKSAYIRRLIEQDLRLAYGTEPEMVPLEEVRRMVSEAVADVLSTLTTRYGHAA